MRLATALSSPAARLQTQLRRISLTGVGIATAAGFATALFPFGGFANMTGMSVASLGPLALAFLYLAFAVNQWRLTKFAYALVKAEDIVQALDEVVIATDTDGRIEYCNLAAVRLTGRSKSALEGQPIERILSFDRPITIEGTQNSKHSENDFIGASIQNETNERIPLLVRCREIPGQDADHDGRTYVATNLTALFQSQIECPHLSLVDTTTGLPNSLMGRSRLVEMISAQTNKLSCFHLLVLKISRLPSIESVYGLSVGESVLREFGARLRECCSADQFICHLSGGEFVALVAATDEYEASPGAQVVEAMSRPTLIGDNAFELGLTVGMANYPDDGANFDLLLECARDGADHPNNSPGNSANDENASTINEGWRSSRIELELANACRTSQFRLMYQPIVDLCDSELVGFEALVRWDHPQWGTLMPDAFISIAEDSGQIELIDHWVIRQVCRQRREWLDEGIWNVPIAVNLATTDFDHSDFESKLAESLETFHLTPEFLEFELTEKSLENLRGAVIPLLKRLQSSGVAITLDDFGTGYCNLMNLKTLPVDRIKIDREFVYSLPEDENDTLICETVIELAKKRGMKVIAEGVESAAQSEFLRRIGCNFAQGFLWSPPLNAAELSAEKSKRNLQRVSNDSSPMDSAASLEASGIWKVS